MSSTPRLVTNSDLPPGVVLAEPDVTAPWRTHSHTAFMSRVKSSTDAGHSTSFCLIESSAFNRLGSFVCTRSPTVSWNDLTI